MPDIEHKNNFVKYAKGTFNIVYKSLDKRSIIKVQEDKNAADRPKRSVRIWNELNPHLKPPAKIVCFDDPSHSRGWMCPYVRGVQASDAEMAQALIDIYTTTRRIVVDAFSKKNFIKTPAGKIVCVDVGMALLLPSQNVGRKSSRPRRYSITSHETWAKLGYKELYNAFYLEWYNIYPKTINTIKALLFIQANRPNLNTQRLQAHPKLVKQLAKAYLGTTPQAALRELDSLPSQKKILHVRSKSSQLFFSATTHNQGVDVSDEEMAASAFGKRRLKSS